MSNDPEGSVSLSQVIRKHLLHFAALVLTSYICMVVLKIYYDRDVERTVSFWAFDPPVMPPGANLGTIGKHYFGDFGLMHIISRSDNVAIPGFFATPWFPATYLLFSPLTLLPYHLGLAVVLGLIFVASNLPLYLSTQSRRWSQAERFIAIVFFGLLSGPFVMSIDRGNIVGLLPLPLFVLVKSIQDGHEKRAITALIVASLLKPHAIIFVLLFIADRKWRVTLRCIGLSSLLHTIGFLCAGGNPISGLRQVLGSASAISHYTSSFEMQSISNALSGFSAAFPLKFPWLDFTFFEYRNVLSVVLMIWIGVLVLARSRVPSATRLTLLFGIYPMVVPSSPTYNSVVVLALVGCLIQETMMPTCGQLSSWRIQEVRPRMAYGILAVICSQLVQVPFAYRGSASAQRPFAATIFLLFLLMVTRDVVKQKASSPTMGKSIAAAILIASLSALAASFTLSDKKVVSHQTYRIGSAIVREPSRSLCDFSWMKHGVLEIEAILLPNAGKGDRVLFATDGSGRGLTLETKDGAVVATSPSREGQNLVSGISLAEKLDQPIKVKVVLTKGTGLALATQGSAPVLSEGSPRPTCDSRSTTMSIEAAHRSGSLAGLTAKVWYPRATLLTFRWLSALGMLLGVLVLTFNWIVYRKEPLDSREW